MTDIQQTSQTPYTFTPVTLTVGGRGIIITRCTCVEALDLELSLAKVAGSADTTAFNAVVGGDLKAALALGVLDMVGGIAKNLSLRELTRLMDMLFQYVTINGQKVVDLNEAFSNRPRDVWEVFVAAVKHNLGPLGEWLRERSASRKNSPETPTP